MRFLWRACAFAMVAASFAPAADMPTGESLLQHYVERTGGAQAYAHAKNMTMTGTVEIAGRNISGKVMIFEEGEKSWTAMEFAGIGRIEEGFDGQTAWENSALQGPRILEGDEKDSAKRAASLDMMTNWRDVYKDARTVGSEDVDGKAAWKVEMTPKEGKPETFYFDRDSGLLVKTSAILSSPLGEIATEATLSDYRMTGGILTPFSMTENAMSQKIVMRFDTIAYNVDIPADRFALPAEVKAVLNQKK